MSSTDDWPSPTITMEPYMATRHIDQDAWFLYETTSIPYYEQCARLCEEFAHFFNRLITGHDARGMGKVDYWVSRYLTHAENIRRSIELIQLGGDYYPMHDFLEGPSSDFRGLIENAFGCETRDEWRPAFEPMSYACGTGSATLRNNQWAGLYWIDRAQHKDEYELVDRDDSHVGDNGDGIKFAAKHGVLLPPADFPKHNVDRSLTARPGEPCPRNGVWVPAQWADDHAGDFSLAFCMQGRPMQPAYQVLGLEKHVISEAEPEHGLEEFASYSPKTKAVDTTWYFVEKAASGVLQPAADKTTPRLRCEAGQPCPREGWWFTPAKANSRRHFKPGELMPAFSTDYGATIWQWDEQQGQ